MSVTSFQRALDFEGRLDAGFASIVSGVLAGSGFTVVARREDTKADLPACYVTTKLGGPKAGYNRPPPASGTYYQEEGAFEVELTVEVETRRALDSTAPVTHTEAVGKIRSALLPSAGNYLPGRFPYHLIVEIVPEACLYVIDEQGNTDKTDLTYQLVVELRPSVWQNQSGGTVPIDVIDEDNGLATAATAGLPTPTLTLFLSINDSTGTYVRNAANWYGDTEPASFAAVWNSVNAGQRGLSLIGSDIALCAEHFPLAVGNTVRFVNNANTTYVTTIHSVSTITGTDIRVCRLTDEVDSTLLTAFLVPDSIGVAALPPATYSPRPWAMYHDQDRNLLLAKLGDPNSLGLYIDISTGDGTNGPPAAYWQNPVLYDSGQPVYIVNDSAEVALLGHLISSVKAASYLGRTEAIKAAATALDCEGTVQEATWLQAWLV